VIKEWWKSKTVWTGVVVIAVGIIRATGFEIPTELVVTIAGGFGLIGIRDAIN